MAELFRTERPFAGERTIESVATLSVRHNGSIRHNGRPAFKPAAFLAQTGLGRTILDLKKDQTIFAQGDTADAVFYIQKGRVKLTVISKRGKEATIALLGTGNFLGEECIAAIQPHRLATAATIAPSSILRIDRKEMIRALHDEKLFSELFVSYLLSRNARIQSDLVDHLFNSSEKRLARALLLLAQFGKDGAPETVIPKISQEVLAEMIGTTRSRVSFFMNRFRKLGFIEYNGKLSVHSSLLNVVLHD
ncbi:MAG: Crp/Fnr family transcriptional regulator [Acidobacteriia bacterium]|nr:Crp/Fnr family transcriptional regulator [Terriglobia bacterium]